MANNKELQAHYDYTLIAMFDLFKEQKKEESRLQGKIEMLRKEIIAISDLSSNSQSVKDRCDSALNAI